MSWPAYAEYKKSGAPWLGDVPSHWVVDRIKWSVADSQNGVWGNEPDGGSDDIRCVRVADFDRPILRVHNREVTNRKVSASERRGRLLRRGDLILEKSGGGEKSPVGFVVLYDHNEPAVTSNFVAKVSLHQGMEPRFWTYLHHWLYVSRLTQRSIKQTSGIQNLDQQSYLDERVGFPSAREQILIANFLDRETAKIDALVAKQEQLITTLREDRAATITQAVTKGLAPEVEMRNSETKWIENVPRHWDAVPIKRLATSITDGAHISPETDGGIYDFVSTKDVDDRGINFEGALKTSPSSYEYLVRNGCQPEPGDVLFSKDGTIGRTVVVAERRSFVVASSLIIIRPDAHRVDSRFVHFLCQAVNVRQQVESFVKGAGLPRLSISNLRKIVVPLPPLEEQAAITAILEAHLAKVDALIGKSTKAIDTLREYRSALITNAVTGKIDVREAV